MIAEQIRDNFKDIFRSEDRDVTLLRIENIILCTLQILMMRAEFSSQFIFIYDASLICISRFSDTAVKNFKRTRCLTKRLHEIKFILSKSQREI